MNAKSLRFFLIILVFAFSLGITSPGCCFWGDDDDYSSLSFDGFVDAFANAYINNDTYTASLLKAGYPSYYDRMLNNLYNNSNDMSRSQSDRDLAAGFYSWAVKIR